MLRTRTDLTTQTVFSMTFFDWSGSDGKTQVSSYLWVYIVVTVVFTALTIGLWYYFVIHRRTSRKPIEEEKC
jgi:heme/copper-type cytochrome/quinol oxidase subunit 2